MKPIDDETYVTLKSERFNKTIKIVDLFAGIGGFHYGISAAAANHQRSVEAVLVSEIEESCKLTYQKNFGGEIHGDINKVNLKDFKNLEIDILTAGFPCQPFSNSGHKLGLKDPRGNFYARIETMINHFSAKSFILENVPGITSNGGGSFDPIFAPGEKPVGRTMNILEKRLKKLSSYHIQWLTLDSSNFGSPQVRKRVYIIGIRNDIADEISLSFPTFSKNNFISIADNRSKEYCIPELELTETQESNIRSFMRNEPPKFRDEMRRVGQAYKCAGGNVGQAYHACGMVPTLTKTWSRFMPIYFPSPGESAPKIGEKDFRLDKQYGKGYIRRASIREVMRLQGFPKEFTPHETEHIAYSHAGNAVNAKVAREIATQLLKTILA
jgi:DNA-cytosine methyltransferase